MARTPTSSSPAQEWRPAPGLAEHSDESATASDDTEEVPLVLGGSPLVAKRGRAAAPCCAAVAGIALLGAALGLGGFDSRKIFGNTAQFAQLADANPCAELPYIRAENVTHSNLGGHGPDKGEEGITYEFEAYTSWAAQALNGSLKLHATSPYVATKDHLKFNGIHGRFMVVLVSPGTNVSLKLQLTGADNKPMNIPHAMMTFFDFDEDTNHSSSEWLTIGKFKHFYIANGTTVNATMNPDGTATFRATKFGRFADNPTDSKVLTELQKKKGVTLEFGNVSLIPFTIGATAGTRNRGFSFIIRPSMLCADTLLTAGGVVGAMGPGALGVMRDGLHVVTEQEVEELAKTFGYDGELVVNGSLANLSASGNGSAKALPQASTKASQKSSARACAWARLLPVLTAGMWAARTAQS